MKSLKIALNPQKKGQCTEILLKVPSFPFRLGSLMFALIVP